ncbi:pyrroloquinoline quinone biosynthesis protein PqqB [bacterium]|nr:pyrroloquinoline quinone biosynthesis protein PqqB [bacterium]
MGPFAVVLGVAQDGGHPHPGCRGECCRAAWEDPALGHRVACLGLVAEGRGWLVDATPDLPRQARALEEAGGALEGILLTHGHMGHTLGLGYLGPEAMNAAGLPVWALPRLAASLAGRPGMAVRRMEAGAAVALAAGLAATPLVVPHRGPTETAAFVVRGPGGALLWAPDTDGWEGWKPSLEEAVAQVDIAYLDGTFFAAGELAGREPSDVPHPLVEETLRRLAEWSPRERAKVRFVHHNHTNPLLVEGAPAAALVAAAGAGVAREGERLGL